MTFQNGFLFAPLISYKLHIPQIILFFVRNFSKKFLVSSHTYIQNSFLECYKIYFNKTSHIVQLKIKCNSLPFFFELGNINLKNSVKYKRPIQVNNILTKEPISFLKYSNNNILDSTSFPSILHYMRYICVYVLF